MLQWVHEEDGWRSNGFVIRMQGPSRWALVENVPDDGGAVRVVPEPLAVESTLSCAKREAELLTEAATLASSRRTWAIQFVAFVAATIVALDLAEPWNMFLSFGFTGAATRALVRLAGTWVGRWLAQPGDVFYQ